MKKIGLLVIGDELLIGQTVDTNSAWLGEAIAARGWKCTQQLTISDEKNDIVNGIKFLSKQVDLIICTGGLGPTKDDITKGVLVDYFNDVLVLNKEVQSKIKEAFELRGVAYLPVHDQQAMLPKRATTLMNYHGTASGMWFKNNEVDLISLPGVPTEMKGIMTDGVFPALEQEWGLGGYYFKSIITEGIGESSLAEMVKDWEQEVRSAGFDLAYLPSRGSVKLRLGLGAASRSEAKAEVEQKLKALEPLIQPYFVGEDFRDVFHVLVEQLKGNNQTISAAESCTGGGFMAGITKVPGSSSVFPGGIVSYSNEVKMKELGVSEEFLVTWGAVSEEVAKSMAEGVRKKMGTDIGVGVTGIAGPDADGTNKPIGLVWFGISTNNGTFAAQKKFSGGREGIRAKAAHFLAAELVRNFL